MATKKKAPAKKPATKKRAVQTGRTSSAERIQKSVEIGLKIAQKKGLGAVSVRQIAIAQNVSAPLIFRCVGNRDELLKKIKAAAKKAGVTLADDATKKAAPRKREIKEVKAIAAKNAAPAAKKSAPAKKAAKKAAKRAAPAGPKFPTLQAPAASSVVVPQAPQASV